MTENFKLPTPEQFRCLCLELELNEAQTRALGQVLHESHANLKAVLRRKSSDQDRKKILVQLSKASDVLGDLLPLLKITPRDFRKFNRDRHLALGTLAGAIAALRIANVIGGRSGGTRDQTTRATTFRFEVLDLIHQIVVVKEGVDYILGAAVTDRGGRNPYLVRNYLAMALARSSQEIINRPATATASGKFVELVRAVFVACRLSDEGLEKLVQRTVRSLKESK